MRIQQLDVSVETKTRDNVFVNLVVSVQYQAHLNGNTNKNLCDLRVRDRC